MRLGTRSLTGRQPRGSVLVFSVVLLSILAMLGTAYIVVVRQSGTASTNAIANVQTQIIVDTGLRVAQRGLDTAFRSKLICSPFCVFDPTNIIDYRFIGDPDELGPPEVSYLQMFAGNNPMPGITFEPSMQALLFSPNDSDVHYSSAPLYTQQGATQQGWMLDFRASTANNEAINRARRYVLQSDIDDFYPDKGQLGNRLKANNYKTKVTTSTRGSGMRGEYCIWISDLDAKLYAAPRAWGINVPNSEAVIQNILNELKVQADPLPVGVDLMNIPDSELTEIMRIPLDPLTGIAQETDFDSMQSFIHRYLPSLFNDVSSYDRTRGAVEHYFTALADVERGVKTTPAAININTCDREVLRASLSQIPLSNKPLLLPWLVERILEKRPFLCRMDFEDFLAAQLAGDTASVETKNFDNIKLSPTPLSAIFFAMTKRSGVATAQFELNPWVYFEMPDLYLTKWTELPDTNALKIYWGATASGPGPRMLDRFRYFVRSNRAAAAATGPDANSSAGLGDANGGLTVGDLNNVLNSFSNIPDDVQDVAYLQAPSTGDRVVSVGANLLLDTVPCGDDRIRTGTDGLPYISAGPDGVCNTQVFGFSYYSHDFALNNVPDSLKQNGWRIYKPRTADPRVAGKFVYGTETGEGAPAPWEPSQIAESLPTVPLPQTADPGYVSGAPLQLTDEQLELLKRKNYALRDLSLWSCVGNGQRSGFYDLCFNFDDVMLYELNDVLPEPDPSDPDPIVRDKQPLIAKQITNPLLATAAHVKHYDDKPVVALGEDTYFASYPDLVITPGENDELETVPGGDDIVVWAILEGPNFDYFDASEYDTEVFDDNYTYLIADYTMMENFTNGVPRVTPNTGLGNLDGRLVQIIIDLGTDQGSDGKRNTVFREADDYLYAATAGDEQVVCGANLKCETFVWGPLRACQKTTDMDMPANLSKRAATTIADGLMGDVSWSPQFCYRSRYFGIYVLGRGMNAPKETVLTSSSSSLTQGSREVNLTFSSPTTTEQVLQLANQLGQGMVKLVDNPPVGVVRTPEQLQAEQHVYRISEAVPSGLTLRLTLPEGLITDFGPSQTISLFPRGKVTSERRIEAVYDALTDKILWQRSPATDKRALGDEN